MPVFTGDSELHWAAMNIYLEHTSHVWNKSAGFHLKPSEKPSSTHKIHPGMMTKAVNQEERDRGSRHTSLLRSVATEPLSLSRLARSSLRLAWCAWGDWSLEHLQIAGTSLRTLCYETERLKALGVLICELGCYSGLISWNVAAFATNRFFNAPRRKLH